jgi:hypothetical protein
MICWMIVVSGFHNALRTVSAEDVQVCNSLMIKEIMLLVTAVYRHCIMLDLKDTAEYENL